MTIATAADVLAFWRAAGQQKWFAKNDAFDAEIRSRFLPTYEAAARRRAVGLGGDAGGRAGADASCSTSFRATCSAAMPAPSPPTRPHARSRIARWRAASIGQVPEDERLFFYLPFEHSESMADQDRCCALFRALGNADLLHWAELHADIIRRFGRFPHRNAVLGRTTTPAEKAFLDNDGFAG